VLDGNVERVICRLLACGEDPARATVRRRLRAAAAALLDARSPGESNQALMELGALVCTPRAPRCGECPLAWRCSGRASGSPESFPRRAPRPAPRRVPLAVAIVERAGRVLLFRRDENATLLAGTWELPWVEGVEGDDGAAAERLGARYGGRFRLGATLGRVRHAITTRRLEATVRRAQWFGDDQIGEGPEAAWLRRDELAGVPVSSLVRKALALAP
jgi:A/G-specific adenine glycosylase